MSEDSRAAAEAPAAPAGGVAAGRVGASSDTGRRPTIYDVARQAGVSKSLVSLVLQDSPLVSEARRAAVRTAIAELGYRPSREASVLASRRTRTVEVVIDDYRNLSFVGLVHGLQAELSDLGYHLTVTEALAERSGRGLDASTRSVDGLVVAGEPDEQVLRAWTGPVVVAGHRDRVPPGADLVANDDALGGRLATGHLLGLGHHRIGHLTGTGGPARQRCAGYTRTMRSAGLEPLVAGHRRGTSEEDGYWSALELIDRDPDISAVFAANDPMALGTLAALRERGRTVPDDVSLVGYDNTPLAQSRYLALTSVDDRSEAVGAEAARALTARIADPSARASVTLVQPVLVVRGTTRPLR